MIKVLQKKKKQSVIMAVFCVDYLISTRKTMISQYRKDFAVAGMTKWKHEHIKASFKRKPNGGYKGRDVRSWA